MHLVLVGQPGQTRAAPGVTRRRCLSLAWCRLRHPRGQALGSSNILPAPKTVRARGPCRAPLAPMYVLAGSRQQCTCGSLSRQLAASRSNSNRAGAAACHCTSYPLFSHLASSRLVYISRSAHQHPCCRGVCAGRQRLDQAADMQLIVLFCGPCLRSRPTAVVRGQISGLLAGEGPHCTS